MEMETREREERRRRRFARDDGDELTERRTYRTLDEQEGRLS
jgi:hypothetical protein